MANKPLPPPPQKTPKGAAQPHGLQSLNKRRSRRWFWVASIGAIIVVILASIVGSLLWYKNALEPVNRQNTEKVRIVVEEGSTVAQIGKLLQAENLIRSPFAFELYMRGEGSPQAGGYALSQSMSVSEIADHLVEGRFDDFDVTLLPGSTIWDIKANLVATGFTADEVDAALDAHYDHPILATKPADASLEGYIFPDTYRLEGDSTVQDLFMQAFDELARHIKENDLEAKFKAHGLTVYEALTLASIVQKEVASPDDMRQVAQVFYKRLAEDIPLGADATFIYGAKVLGVEPRVTLDSPYNTREVKGLPPGPISNMELSALQAVANPAEGDYLYFVSGDDGTTHFTRTLEEHEEATRRYCRENCDIFQN